MGWSLRTSSMNLVCILDTAQLGKIFVHYINTTQVILKLLLCKKPDNIESSTFCVYNIHTPIWRRKCRKIHVVCTYFYCKEKPSNSSLLNKKGILNAIQRSHTIFEKTIGWNRKWKICNLIGLKSKTETNM